MRKGIAVALLAVSSVLPALAADLAITYKVKGKDPLGKPLDGTQVHYFSSTRMRLDDSGAKSDLLIDYEAQVRYSIQHDKKSISKITFKELGDVLKAGDDMIPGMSEMIVKEVLGDVGDVKVEVLGKDMVIGRSCDKVRVTVGKMIMESSVDTSLKAPLDYAKGMRIAHSVSGPFGVALRKMYDELAKLKGVALKSHTSGLMGMEMTLEATAISQATLPASTWALPNYPVVDEGKKMKKDLRD